MQSPESSSWELRLQQECAAAVAMVTASFPEGCEKSPSLLLSGTRARYHAVSYGVCN